MSIKKPVVIDEIVLLFEIDFSERQASGLIFSEDNWFWQETAVSKILFRILALCLKSEDKRIQLVGKMLLVPMAQAKSEDE